MKTQTYHVTWEIDVEAGTPQAAAREAFACMQEPGTTATVFDVTDKDGKIVHVDLMEA